MSLNIIQQKVTPSTAKSIRTYIFENKSWLENETKFFYAEAAGLIESESRKKAAQRRTMAELLKIVFEMSFEPETFAKRIGAESFEVQFA